MESLVYFEVVTTIALIIGLVMIKWPGKGVKGIDLSVADTAQKLSTERQDWQQIVLHTPFLKTLQQICGRRSGIQCIV